MPGCLLQEGQSREWLLTQILKQRRRISEILPRRRWVGINPSRVLIQCTIVIYSFKFVLFHIYAIGWIYYSFFCTHYTQICTKMSMVNMMLVTLEGKIMSF